MILMTQRFFKVVQDINHPVIKQLINRASYSTFDKVIESNIDSNIDENTFLNLHQYRPINCLDLDDVAYGLISYTPNDKLALIKERNYISFASDFEFLCRQYFSKLRQNSKPGKAMAKLFGEQFTQIQYSEVGDLLNTAILAFYANNYGVAKIVSGEDIRKYYHADNYANGSSGPLGTSCMRHDSCQQYLDIYVDNPIIKMIVLTNDKGVLARALLWDNKYYDRIYFANNHAHQSMLAFCKSNNFIEIYDTSIEVSIQLEKWMYEEYPYLDTFRFLNKDTGVLTNTGLASMMLSNTDGTYNYYFYCNKCDMWRAGAYTDDTWQDICQHCNVWSSKLRKFIDRSTARWSNYYNSYIPNIEL